MSHWFGRVVLCACHAHHALLCALTAQVVAAAALLSRYARPAAVPESAGAVEPSASVAAAGAAGRSAAPVSPESEQMVAEHTNTGAAGTITATTTTAHQQQRSTVLSGAVHGGLMGLSASGLSPHAAPFVATGAASSCPGSINTAGSANSASASVAAVATTTTTNDAATIAPSEVGYGFAVPCTTTNLTNAFEQIHYDGSGRSAAAQGGPTCAGGNGASIYALPTVDGSSHGGSRDGALADVLFAHNHMGVCVGSSIIGSDGGGAATSAHHGIAAAVTAAKSGGNVSLLVAQQQQQQHAMVTAAMAAASASKQVQLLHELGGGDPLLLAADAAYAADGLDKPGTAQVRQQQEQRQCNLVHIALQ